MEFVDFEDDQTIVNVTYKGAKTIHHLRSPSPEESLEYRRRSSKYRLRKGTAEPTDDALKAPLWLYDKICEKVDGAVFGGKPLMEVENWRQVIPVRLKEAVINSYLSQVEPGEEEEGN